MKLRNSLLQILLLWPPYRKLWVLEQNVKQISIVESEKTKVEKERTNLLKAKTNSLEKEIRTLQQTVITLSKKIDRVPKSKPCPEDFEAVIKKSSAKAISDSMYLFDGLISNRLESQLYNLGIQKEKEKNKPLFLIGSGPSLKDCDVSKLENCYTMSFNRSYIAFDDWGFEPTYFAGTDKVVNKDNIKEFRELISNSKIERFFFNRDENTLKNFLSSKTTLVEIGDPFNPNLDFQKRLRTGNTGLFGLQVALGILGFKEVYLLGCDASYEEKVKDVITKGYEYTSKSDSDPNHFRPDYFGKGKKYNKPFANEYHLPLWKSFFEGNIKNNKEGFKVYNCSKTGKLTFFEYKDFDEVVKNIKKYER